MLVCGLFEKLLCYCRLLLSLQTTTTTTRLLSRKTSKTYENCFPLEKQKCDKCKAKIQKHFHQLPQTSRSPINKLSFVLRFAVHYSESLSVKLENFINTKLYRLRLKFEERATKFVCLFVCLLEGWTIVKLINGDV